MCYLCPQSRTATHKAGDREIARALNVWRRKRCHSGSECQQDRHRCEQADLHWTERPAKGWDTWTAEDFARHQARGTLPMVLHADANGNHHRNTAVKFDGYPFDWRRLL